jgi:hypothetical protein
MPFLSHRFGPTTIAKLSDPHELKQLLVDPWFQSETIIIKPNLVASAPGIATDPRAQFGLIHAIILSSINSNFYPVNVDD